MIARPDPIIDDYNRFKTSKERVPTIVSVSHIHFDIELGFYYLITGLTSVMNDCQSLGRTGLEGSKSFVGKFCLMLLTRSPNFAFVCMRETTPCNAPAITD